MTTIHSLVLFHNQDKLVSKRKRNQRKESEIDKRRQNKGTKEEKMRGKTKKKSTFQTKKLEGYNLTKK